LAVEFLSTSRMAKVSRAVESGRIIPFLALTTLLITAIGGVAAWLLAPDGFDSLGDALWFAAQTVTTVGYGDVVPDTAAGRLIGLGIMLFGVAAVSVITALVTSAFVTYQRERIGAEAARHEELREILARVESRLEALERQR
jgi:voltage-gated potassium channel